MGPYNTIRCVTSNLKPQNLKSQTSRPVRLGHGGAPSIVSRFCPASPSYRRAARCSAGPVQGARGTTYGLNSIPTAFFCGFVPPFQLKGMITTDSAFCNVTAGRCLAGTDFLDLKPGHCLPGTAFEVALRAFEILLAEFEVRPW